MRAYLTVAVLLLLIFGGIGTFLFGKFSMLAGMDFTPPPVTVAAATAREDVWETKLETVGTIRATRGVELSAETSGEIIAISANSGDSVVAGDLIVTLNDSVELASRERQIANLELAKLLFERDASLVKKKSIPQSQYDRSKADLDSAIATLAETEARLNNKSIVAPFDGTVGLIRVKVGDYIESGTSIANLQDLTELEVDFSVPARHFPRLHKGQEIEVHTAAFPEAVFKANLQAVDSEVNANTRNLMLRAKLAPGSGLLPGMFARLNINLGIDRTVVTVPETALAFSLQGDTIYIIRESDGILVAEPRIVKSGPARNGRVAILDGVKAGDRIVTVGQNKLYRGARIELDDTVYF